MIDSISILQVREGFLLDTHSTLVVIDTIFNQRPKRRTLVDMIYKFDSSAVCLEFQMVAFA